MTESILQEAQRLIHGDRNASYGHPLDNHSTTAEMVTAFLRRKYGRGMPKLDAEDVCWFNVLQKVAREANVHKRDNGVDICGYAGNVEMIRDERARRAEAQQTFGPLDHHDAGLGSAALPTDAPKPKGCGCTDLV